MSAHQIITIDADILPSFTAAYLRLAGNECAFIETHTSLALPRLLKALRDAGREPGEVRWVVVTHAHLDHAAGAGAVLRACPNATLLAHPRAARNLIDPSRLVASATSVYGAERFAALYGTVEAIPAARVRSLADAETFELGDATFHVLHTAGHANHHFAVHDPALDTIFTGDTFGLVYPALQTRGLFALASTSPTQFDAVEARKSLARILALRTRSVYPTHFGDVQRPAEVAAQVGAWIDRAETWLSLAVATDKPIEALTTDLAESWRRGIAEDAEARGLGFGPKELELLALDIELNAQGLAVVADARRKA